jgi:hypothetical protein
MEATVAKIAYTIYDMKELANCSSGELAALLENMDYDPNAFEEMLTGIPKDHHFLFEVPFEDLPEHLDNARLMGYINFRFKVGK